jgi:hypothetical protein
MPPISEKTVPRVTFFRRSYVGFTRGLAPMQPGPINFCIALYLLGCSSIVLAPPSSRKRLRMDQVRFSSHPYIATNKRPPPLKINQSNPIEARRGDGSLMVVSLCLQNRSLILRSIPGSTSKSPNFISCHRMRLESNMLLRWIFTACPRPIGPLGSDVRSHTRDADRFLHRPPGARLMRSRTTGS